MSRRVISVLRVRRGDVIHLVVEGRGERRAVVEEVIALPEQNYVRLKVRTDAGEELPLVFRQATEHAVTLLEDEDDPEIPS